MKTSLSFNVIATIFIYFVSTRTILSCLVETPSGCIEGKTEWFGGFPVRAFLGIPYAKAPIGDLRFRKPVPYGKWNTTLQAKNLSPACVQYSTNPFPWLADASDSSLDCLFLNIWTPASANPWKKKSVMFWIHTGGFRIGTSSLDVLNGKVLAAVGDVIVVTFNYRLAVEGFFYSETEDAPGNVGLWDMVEALKWVRENIPYFGGDENSITVFGQSAGGIATGLMCLSPVTRGLFKRVILQSGAPTKFVGEEDRSFEVSQNVASTVGCADGENSLSRNPNEVVDCLRDKDGYKLAVALNTVTAYGPRYYLRFGDELLPKNIRLAIINGDFASVDVLIGSTNGDGATLITKSMKDVFGFFGEKNPQISYNFGASIIRKNFQSFPDAEPVVQQYLGDVQQDDYDEIRFQVFTASGDYDRTCPSNYFAESFAKKRNTSVYMYFFTHRPSYTPWAPWMLAVHHDEVPFVFGYPLRHPHLYTSEEVVLSKRMIRAWSSFAKTGVPGDENWPKYSTQYPLYQKLDIGNNIHRFYGPHQKNCNFFRSYFGF